MALAMGRDPLGTAIVISYVLALMFLIALLLRLVAMAAAMVRDPTIRIAPASGDDLPRYAVLVPLYREPEVVPALLAALTALDYPPERLDIQILLEDDDDTTAQALAQQVLPGHIRCTVAPPGKPRTKPRACNEGLARAAGDCEFLVIFDAEDRPDTDQLRKAIAAYRMLPPEVVCLQSRLAHYNACQSLTAGWSAVEYLAWFRLHLPGLQSLRAPIPLGGTSNHFRLAALRELDGWDPFNVTEDCDLGMRIARRGWRTAVLDSTTWEEAVSKPGAWVRQRSRWVKGYLQTWLVHSRAGASGNLGPWATLWLAATVGGTVVMHLVNPFAWLVMLAWLGIGWSIVDITSTWSQVTLGFTIALVAANLLFLLSYVHVCLRAGRRDLLAAATTMPVAWLLHSIAAWRAVYDLIVRPFHWAKTTHGQALIDRLPSPPITAAASGPPKNLSKTIFADGLSTRRLRLIPVLALAFGVVLTAATLQRANGNIEDDVRRQNTSSTPPVLPVQLPLHNQGYPAFSLVAAIPQPPDPWHVVEDASAPATTLSGLRPVFATTLTTPGVVKLASTRWRNISDFSLLAVDAWIPASAPPWMTLTCYLRDEDRHWFEHTSEQRLLPGAWTRIELPFDREWTGRGHQRPWCRELRARIPELGFQVAGATPWAGELRLANLRGISRDDGGQRVKLERLQALPARIDLMQRAEMRFSLSRLYDNPFDPEVVDVTCTFTTATATARHTEVVPAFWAQDYRRRLEEDHELTEPVGIPGWRIRYRPRRCGDYTWHIAVRDASGTVQLDQGSFSVAPTADTPSYLHRSREKPELFCLDDGSTFWPIGQNICQPVDLQQPFPYRFPVAIDQGTFTYDRLLGHMGEARMTWGRIWMTPWAFGLEGPPTWPHFRGQGRYNLANAWRLDHVLEEAAHQGVRIQLTTMHQSELVRDNCWRTSSWNPANGGSLRQRNQFFRDPSVLAAYRMRMRYLVARWGDDPTIAGWEFFGEANLMPGYKENEAAQWHQEMAEYVRTIDHDRHLIFTHTHNWQDGHALWALDGIDIVQGNGYIRPPNHTSDHLLNFDRYLAEVAHYRKPVMIAEYGGRSEQGAPDGDYLEAQLHSGLWASLVEPFAGAAMPWWWDFTEGANLYHHFRALADFNTGIDRIRHDYRPVRPSVAGAAAEWRAAGMQDETSGFYWVHHQRIFEHWQHPPLGTGFVLQISGLRPGTYHVSFWNTSTGAKTETRMESASGTMQMPLPTIAGDLGIRVEREASPP